MVNSKRNAGQPGISRASLWEVVRHDFRQPAQSLELLATAMASARTDEARRQCAERTSDLAAALRAMIEGLTLVSRLEAGELSVATALVPLASAVKSAILLIGEHGSVVQPGELAGDARTDPALLAVALEGLLLYSAKFAATELVTVTAETSKREAVIEIGFDGRHPRSALTSLAFVEMPPAAEGKRPKVGLGPALVARLAAAQGWRLELVAPSDRLSRVVLVLPVAPSS